MTHLFLCANRQRYLLAVLALAVQNPSFAGGYVYSSAPLNPAASIPGASGAVLPTFNNATLTDKNNISETNNNVIKTPHTADPVSTVTGNNFHDETDFVIKGRAGLNYAFTRTYNSAPSATNVAGVLGYGWTHSYAMKLKSNDYGSCPNCTSAQDPVNGNRKTSSITYTDERGGDHNYLVNESTYAITAPQGEFDSLALDTPSAGQTTITFRNGTKYVFTTVGSSNIKTTPGVTARLTQIADPWGNQLNFGYDGNGRLSAVTDNLGITGRTGLVFAYDTNGNLSTIKDWAGRTWTYVVNGTSKQLTSFTAAQAPSSGATYTYSYAPGTNNLQTIAKPLQRNGKTVSTTFAYYTNGRTFNYQDALGNVETLDYDLYRKTTRVTDPRGGIREYEYDSSGRLTKLTEPDGGILLFANTTTDGLRYQKKDGLGYPTQYSYRSDKSFNSASDSGGNVTREQDALSNTIDTIYGPLDQVQRVKDKRGNETFTVFCTYTDATASTPGRLKDRPQDDYMPKLTTAPGVVASNFIRRSYVWNADGTLSYTIDQLTPNLNERHFVTFRIYEPGSKNLNVQVIQMDGRSLAACATGNCTTTDILQTWFTYDNLGRVKTQTVKRRTSPTDATKIDLTTSYDYDAMDRVVKVTDPLGNVVINRYDDNGQLWQVTHQYLQPGGTYDTRNIVTRTFDAADRVASETDALGGVTTYSYDQAGNVIAVKDAENHTTRFEYDAMNRRTAVIDANGNRTTTAYNLRGEVVSVTNAAGETTSFQYDALGRKTQVTDPHGYITKFTSYDANGNLLCRVDANAQAGLQPKNSDGCTESRQYDELNRVTLIRDALNGTTAFSYDLLGNTVTQLDAEGRQYTWTYDELGRLSSETDFTGKTTSYLSDEAGNIWQKTNRLGEVTQTTYDKLNRPTNVLYKKDNSTETLSYDPAGTLHSAANSSSAGSVTYTFGYDNLKRMLSKADSRGKSLSFTYDKTGNIQTKTTYQGSTTRYTYDSANRLVNASNPDYLSVNYQYDAAGRLLSRVMSSGARSLYAYDNGGWLNSLTHYDAAGSPLSTQSYNRDRLGHITALTTAAGATNYTLDALYRLTTVAAPTAANSEYFTYDHIGNRLTATRGGTSIGAPGSTTKYYNYVAATQTATPVGLSGAYTPTYNNRLKEIRIGSVSGTLDSSLSFDNEGRLSTQTGTGAKTLTWDAKSRVASVTAGGSTESYVYDPMDHRIQRSGGSLGNLSYYLEGDHLESVYSGGTLQEKYFRGSTIDELVAGYTYQSGSLTPFMFQHDQVMSVSATTKTNGGTQATQTFWAFGEAQSATGTSVTRLGYTGRENDGNGLMQYRARYYDPATGRFISEDPKKFAAGINFYAYVGNDPINANDPSGMDVVIPPGPSQAQLSNLFESTVSQLQQTTTGQRLLSSILDPKNKITLTTTNDMISSVKYQNKNGSYTGTVKINPSADIGTLYQTDDGSYVLGPISPERVLGHELGHPGFNMSDTGPQKMDYVNKYENQMFAPLDGLYRQTYMVSPTYGQNDLINTSPQEAQNIINNRPLPSSSPSRIGGDALFDSGAAGGFLLYPNKPNNNSIFSVYRK